MTFMMLRPFPLLNLLSTLFHSFHSAHRGVTFPRQFSLKFSQARHILNKLKQENPGDGHYSNCLFTHRTYGCEILQSKKCIQLGKLFKVSVIHRNVNSTLFTCVLVELWRRTQNSKRCERWKVFHRNSIQKIGENNVFVGCVMNVRKDF